MSEEAKAITCPVCQNTCSSQAAACPKCGHPINQTPAVVRVETEEPKPEQTDAGMVLRGIMWVLFAISGIYALGAIAIHNNKPLPVHCILRPNCGYDNADEISAANFAMAYHVAPFIIMLIVLAIAYSAKGKR